MCALVWRQKYFQNEAGEGEGGRNCKCCRKRIFERMRRSEYGSIWYSGKYVSQKEPKNFVRHFSHIFCFSSSLLYIFSHNLLENPHHKSSRETERERERKMSAGFLRNGTKTYHSIHNLLQKQPATDSIGAAIIRSQPHHRQQQSRVYARFSQSVYRRTRELQLSPPSVLSLSFSSSTTVSSSRNGLVGWYLEMVKARPIAHQNITGALIYTAADLSSQVTLKRKPIVCFPMKFG